MRAHHPGWEICIWLALVVLGGGVSWQIHRVGQRLARLEMGCSSPVEQAVATPLPPQLRAVDMQWQGVNLSLPLPTGVPAQGTRLVCRFVDERFGNAAVAQVELWPTPTQPDPARVRFPLRQVFWEAGECDFYGYGRGTQYGWFRVAAGSPW